MKCNEINPSNYIRCVDYKPDCEDTCNDGCVPSKNISDILTSIALQEAALSHILNAEGEKIQKTVQLSCSTKEMLCVNESVMNTIDSITSLEVMLLNKLKVALGAKICDYSPLPIVSCVCVKGHVIMPCGCAAKNASVTLTALCNHIVKTDDRGRFCFPSVDVENSFSIKATCNNYCSTPITKCAPFNNEYTVCIEL